MSSKSQSAYHLLPNELTASTVDLRFFSLDTNLVQEVLWKSRYGARLRGLESFDSQINQLFDQALGQAWSSASSDGTVGYPAVDVLESKEFVPATHRASRYEQGRFNLEMKNGMLTISAERKLEELVSGVQYRSVELVAGRFSRSFNLPETVRQDGIQATYRDGILEIYVPKLEFAKARQIRVN